MRKLGANHALEPSRTTHGRVSFFYLYVDDIDATYQRALQAGAVSLEMPQDLPYGDRRGMVKDPCGNIWQIATHKEDVISVR
ncbi:MAG: hypothetical protein AUH43_17810 [Acidobacteria bacterium 13_1_40CM_65_14]|nr:MAG: hypothetical protein AUH43_17810 [Acidobacteria bacterium 13_1_40CM_65_14]